MVNNVSLITNNPQLNYSFNQQHDILMISVLLNNLFKVI
jgi:hypothetical protein